MHYPPTETRSQVVQSLFEVKTSSHIATHNKLLDTNIINSFQQVKMYNSINVECQYTYTTPDDRATFKPQT